MSDATIKFSAIDPKMEMKVALETVYDALEQRGYNPMNQLVGYLISEDPTYITNFNNARTIISKIDRDDLLQELLRYYLDK